MQNILSKIILFRPVALRPGLSTGLPFLCAGGKVLPGGFLGCPGWVWDHPGERVSPRKPCLYREMSHRKTDQHKSCYFFLA